ncbi:MAG: pyridoxal-dependent decarboxylase [Cytophagaceae bacterium]|nr:pyridoxal-dependent decarboxylase [Gemmatimonadaceae bacterium]
MSPAADFADVARRFDEPIPQHGRPLAEVLARLERDVLAGVNHLSHPMYLGHQVSAPLPTGVWTDALISAVNNSQAVNEMSPTLSHVERRVVRWMCELVGWDARSGGTFTSGGTEASFTALLAARAVLMPDAWEQGVGGDPPVMLCGEHTHYAVSRAAGQLGLGVRNIVVVPSEQYCMSPEALRTQLDALRSAGRRVMAVVATAGHTATGGFDDLEAIGRTCEAFGAWLHVDGAHGASAVFSPAHRHRLRGIERAHSIAWDPHKMMFLPLAAGTVLVREARWLDAAFTQRAPYLFNDDGTAESINIGVRSFQCSRRTDALKAWVALQRHGTGDLAAWYDLLCDLTCELHGLLVRHPCFEVLHEPECNILCFRWVGAPRSNEDLDRVNAEVRERYNASGDGWITSTVLGGRRVLRVTVQNPRTRPEHLERLVTGLDAVARELTTS